MARRHHFRRTGGCIAYCFESPDTNLRCEPQLNFPSCFSPACAGRPAASTELKQMDIDGQLRTVLIKQKCAGRTAELPSQQVLLPKCRELCRPTVAQGLPGCCGLGPWGQLQGCQDLMWCVKFEETVGGVRKVCLMHCQVVDRSERQDRLRLHRAWTGRTPAAESQPLASRSRHHSTYSRSCEAASCLLSRRGPHNGLPCLDSSIPF